MPFVAKIYPKSKSTVCEEQKKKKDLTRNGNKNEKRKNIRRKMPCSTKTCRNMTTGR